jgi:PA14 domain-containing protein
MEQSSAGGQEAVASVSRFGSFTLLLLAVVGLFAVVKPVRACAQENILRNSNLTLGKDAPDSWSTEAWQRGTDFTTFNWTHKAGAPGEVEISSLKPNDASWAQKLHLTPGWYHFTASMRTEGVPTGNTGAYISILEDGIVSDFLYGSNNWRELGFYLKVGEAGADVELACRVGGFASLNTGKAACRDFRGVKIEAPPADATHRYELDLIRGGGIPPPSSGTNNSTLVMVLFAAAIAVLVGILIWRRSTTRSARLAESSDTMQGCSHIEPRRKIEIVLFLVSLLTYAYFYQAADHSTAARFDLIRAMLERHSLWIEGYAGFNTADIVQLNSHVYSNKAPGGSFTGILPWLVVTTILKPFLYPPNGMYWALATYLTTVLCIGVIAASTNVLVYRLALLFGAVHGRAVAVALTLAFATIMFPYATEFTAEPIAAGCVVAAFYLLALPEVSAARAFISGLLAGWATLCDYPTFILAFAIAVYALWRISSMRRAWTFALGATMVAALLLCYNYFAFGHPLFLSYEAYMLPGNKDWFPEQSVGFAGVTYPKAKLLWDVLLDPQRGLFFCNPVLLLTIPGLVYFARIKALRPEFLVISSSIIAFVLFNSSYGESIIYWGGGTATGPRHLLSAVPFMAIALAFLPDGLNGILGAGALVSAFMMLMATAVEPHLPYEYLNPFRDFVWPAYLRGDLAYNKSSYFGGPPIAGDSVAFNLGKLMGLPGALQLLPLAAIWVAGALYILNALREASRKFRMSIAVAAAAVAIATLFTPPMAGALLDRHEYQRGHGLLGRYYEGSRPDAFPPHIRRIDKEINFDNLAQLGALPPPSVVVWTGEILAPAVGLYRFTIEVDDSGWLKIDDLTVIADPGEISKMRDTGSIYLSTGSHRIELGERNIWGEASMRLFWQPPGAGQELVPSASLTPRDYEDRLARP